MVEVCGVKYVEGTGKKSGKPYKAYIVHFTEDGKRQGFKGYITGDAFIDVSLLDGQTIEVGDKLRLFYDKSGFLQAVEFVQ